MTDLKTLRQTLRDLAERAPNWQANEIERVSHDRGEFSYEINRDDMFVAFYEDHFKPVMKAKFAADLFAATNPENLLRLLDALEEAEKALQRIELECTCPGKEFTTKVFDLSSEALSKLRGGR